MAHEMDIAPYDQKTCVLCFAKKGANQNIGYQLVLTKRPQPTDIICYDNSLNENSSRMTSILSGMLFSRLKTPSYSLKISVTDVNTYLQSVKYFISIRDYVLELGGSKEEIENLYGRFENEYKTLHSTTKRQQTINAPSQAPSETLNVSSIENSKEKDIETKKDENSKIEENAETKNLLYFNTHDTKKEDYNNDSSYLRTQNDAKVHSSQIPSMSTSVLSSTKTNSDKTELPPEVPRHLFSDSTTSKLSASETRKNSNNIDLLISEKDLQRRFEKFQEDDMKSRLNALKGIPPINPETNTIEVLQAKLNRLKGIPDSQSNCTSTTNTLNPTFQINQKETADTIMDKVYEEIRLESGNDLRTVPGGISQIYEQGNNDDDFENFLNGYSDTLSMETNDLKTLKNSNKLPSKDEIRALIKKAKDLGEEDFLQRKLEESTNGSTFKDSEQSNVDSKATCDEKISDNTVNSLIEQILAEPSPPENNISQVKPDITAKRTSQKKEGNRKKRSKNYSNSESSSDESILSSSSSSRTSSSDDSA